MKESSGVVEMKEKKRVAEMGRKTDNVAVTVNYRYLLSLEPSLLGGCVVVVGMQGRGVIWWEARRAEREPAAWAIRRKMRLGYRVWMRVRVLKNCMYVEHDDGGGT
jgi:hypothetical protein